MDYRKLLVLASCITLLSVSGCPPTEVTVTGKDVVGNQATITYKVKGKTSTIVGTVGAGGEVTVPGKGTFEGWEPGSVITIEDPLVIEIPDIWTFVDGNWANPNSVPTSGTISATPISSFAPPFIEGPFSVSGSGTQLLVMRSPEDISDDTVETTVTFTFLHGETTKATLKWLGVLILEGTDASGAPLTRVEPTEGLGVEFSSLPRDHVVFFPDREIPTLSEWGVVAMILILLVAGTIVFGRIRTRQAA